MGDPLTAGLLGTFSQGIYDYLFKIVVDKAHNAIKKPLLKRELKQALARTEERFKIITTDKDIYQAVLACPLHDLPSVAEALSKFYDHPANLTLETTLNQRVSEVFHHLPEDKIKESIANYLSILREELITVSAEYREKQSVLSNIRMEKKTDNIDSHLKSIFSLLNNFIETNRKKEEFKEQMQRLQEDLRERTDLRRLSIAIDVAELYCRKLTLPPKLQDQLLEARRHYEFQQRSKKLPWSEIEKLINNLRSRQYNLKALLKNITKNETYEFTRVHLETGETEVVKVSLVGFAEQLSKEYKPAADDLAEMVQTSVYPLIPEFPFLSASILSYVIQLEILDEYNDDLEKLLVIANQKTDLYERMVRGLQNWSNHESI